MTARIFISYRTSDGMDKATALARDLGERFGDEQVFLDKDDLRGGSSWRDEVQRAIGAKPVLLLLLTPQLFSATDRNGALRIADPNDPVRREFSAALDAGADVLPLCCDGVDSPPTDLPPPFDRIGDYTWRKLRAYDWKNDLDRLVGDLAAQGIGPAVGAASATSASSGATTARTTPARRLALFALGGAGLAVASGLGWWGWRALNPTDDAMTVTGLPGTWLATVDADPPFALTLQRQENELTLTSGPVPIDNREGWASYRDSWRRLTGSELPNIVYRGQGTAIADPGAPLVIDLAWKLYNGAGDTMIDSGNLHATAAADGRSLGGELWSNGAQAKRAIVLRRPR